MTKLLIVIGWLAFVVVASLGAIFMFTLKSNQLRENGIKAEAEIISMKEIGRSDGGNIRFLFTVKFTTQKGTISATGKQFLSAMDLIYVKEHKTIPIWYDKENPQKILVSPVDIPDLLDQ
ncbi:hypothetical protein QL189_15320 [Cronobacter turicensis]|uniref:DUF3592 domain-containing protein n=1 Tax=Cronobacter TaxID=413496 RepID=UPI0013EA2F82|nr:MULTISPECIES: DUF3592 domain-containing protein [Cronobacter]EGT4492142.1 hypothetical protein [Cronobacter turicensis]EKM0436867.1 hypothetical protein [Cronobacter turicensis]ELQ6223409.1 hypothetical protein [Cronobacter turicensis]ELY2783544.1 hypothetical protein [Cronobacter turicensis]ELY3542019.1 hypothetical protein [Cronobacter turicensis]